MRQSTRRRKAESNTQNSSRMMSLFAMLMSAFAFLKDCFALQHRQAKKQYSTDSESAIVRAAQSGIVITVVVIGVVAMVGILIFAQVESAMPTVDGPLNDTMSSITSGFGDAISFVPIIMLVLLASVVIGVVQRMRG